MAEDYLKELGQVTGIGITPQSSGAVDSMWALYNGGFQLNSRTDVAQFERALTSTVSTSNVSDAVRLVEMNLFFRAQEVEREEAALRLLSGDALTAKPAPKFSGFIPPVGDSPKPSVNTWMVQPVNDDGPAPVLQGSAPKSTFPIAAFAVNGQTRGNKARREAAESSIPTTLLANAPAFASAPAESFSSLGIAPSPPITLGAAIAAASEEHNLGD